MIEKNASHREHLIISQEHWVLLEVLKYLLLFGLYLAILRFFFGQKDIIFVIIFRCVEVNGQILFTIEVRLGATSNLYPIRLIKILKILLLSLTPTFFSLL